MKKYLQVSFFLFLLFASYSSSSQPTLSWSKSFPGNYYGDFFFFDSEITLDTASNIYFSADSSITTGSFIGKVDSGGNVIWQTNLMPGPDTFAIRTQTDFEGSTYGVENCFHGSSLFKLSPAGNLLWSSNFLASINIYFFSLDGFGNLYALENSQNLSSNIYKYDTSGNLIWTVSLPFNGMFRGAIDHAGNLITTDGVMHLIKINSSGSIVWDQPITNIPNFGCYQIITDYQNNIVVTGETQPGVGIDFYLGKYDPSGNLLWFVTTDSTNANISIDANTDSAGNVYSAIYIENNSNGDTQLLIRKFNAAGVLQWFYVPSDTISYDDYGYWYPYGPIRISSSGDVYVGTTSSDNQYQSFTIYKFSSAGNLLWKVKERESSQQGDHLRDFKLGSDQSIYAIGKSELYPHGVWLIKLVDNSTGIQEENNDVGLRIFPNPCMDVCRVNFNNSGKYAISVFDQFGKTVYRTKVCCGNPLLINTSEWPIGIYLLQCLDTKRNIRYQSKIVKANY